VERAADKAMIEHQSEGGEATLPVKPEPDFPREGITQLPVRYRAPRRLGVIGCIVIIQPTMRVGRRASHATCALAASPGEWDVVVLTFRGASQRPGTSPARPYDPRAPVRRRPTLTSTSSNLGWMAS
jgi:hypothetical protein